jgi:DNA polymerase-1
MTGRKRHVPEIASDDVTKRSQAERQSVNSIIQGTASDIMKLAMIRLNARFAQYEEGDDQNGAWCL